MVSRKWTCQLSFGLVFPIAAAQPPSAITVWALPNNDLVMTATFEAAFARLDNRTQTSAAGTDDDDVVLMPFDFSSHEILTCLSRQKYLKMFVSQ